MSGEAPLPALLDIVERLPDAVLVVGPDRRTLDYASPVVERVTGLSREALAASWPREWIHRFVHRDDRTVLTDHLFGAVEEMPEGHVRELEFRISALGADRVVEGSPTWRWVNSRVWPRRGPGGHLGTLCILRDVTAEKTALAAMLETEARYAQLFDAISEAVVVFDKEDGRILDANATALARYGYGRDDIRDMRLDDLEADDDKSGGTSPTDRAMQTGFGRPGACRHRSAAGREFPVDVHMGPTVFEGRPAVLAVIVDTSERTRAEEEFRRLHEQIVEKSRQIETTLDHLRQAQAQLVQAQKMEAIGQLAGGIAHDFNNLLTAVIGTIEILLLEMPSDSPYRQDLVVAEQAARQAADLTRRLVALARQRPPEIRAVDLRGVVRAASAVLRRALPDSVRFVENVDDRLPAIRGDAAQIQQAIQNLGLNARDAMPDGGTLFIEADVVSADDSGLARTADGYSGQYAAIRVRDTGCGMAPAVVERVFDPFFTTKESGRGTGLGLSTVYATMRAHCGSVTVDSKPGAGSTFTLLFPIGAEFGSGAGDRPDVLRGAGETVLLVDDDPLVLQTTRRSLELLGYRVLTAGSGAAAVAFMDGSPDQADLVLLDVVMPGTGGVAALRQIRRIRPNVAAVLMTGYGGPEFVPPLDLGAEILRKPLDLAELSSTLRRALENRPGGKT